jgi:hypothetical protein
MSCPLGLIVGQLTMRRHALDKHASAQHDLDGPRVEHSCFPAIEHQIPASFVVENHPAARLDSINNFLLRRTDFSHIVATVLRVPAPPAVPSYLDDAGDVDR